MRVGQRSQHMHQIIPGGRCPYHINTWHMPRNVSTCHTDRQPLVREGHPTGAPEGSGHANGRVGTHPPAEHETITAE
ncbi:hypothetical protein GCM10009634_78340 [Saccharothrix xinjiangensis]